MPLNRRNSLALGSTPKGAISLTSTNFDLWLLAAFFICFYLEISVIWGGTFLFPFFGCFVCSVISLYRNKERLTSAPVGFLLLIGCIFCLSVVLNFTYMDTLTKRLLSLLDVTAALFMGYCWFVTLTRVPREFAAKFFFYVAASMLVFALLEDLDITRSLSDTVRHVIYRTADLYGRDLGWSDVRDAQLYGGVRPKVFLREPSLVGIDFGLSMTLWFVLGSSEKLNKRVNTLIAMFLAAVVIVRSPTLVLFPPIWLIGALTSPRIWGQSRSPLGNTLCWIVLGSLTVLPQLLIWLADALGGVIHKIVYGYSFFMRQTGPYEVASMILRGRPLTGVGVGASKAYFDTVYQIYMVGALRLREINFLDLLLRDRRPDFLLTNGFWQYWATFGVILGPLLIYAIYRLMRSLGVKHSLFVITATCLLMQGMGGIMGFWCWFYLFTFMAAARQFAISSTARHVKADASPISWRSTASRSAPA